MILFKKQLFDLEVKGQGHTKVITVRDTPPYGHAPTYQISLTYLERQKCYGSDKKILFKKQLFDLQVKVPQRSLWYTTHCLMVMNPHTKYHWPISKENWGSVCWACVAHLYSALRKLDTEPSIGASHQISVHFGIVVSEKKIFLEIDQSKTRFACGSHVC